MSWQEDAKCIPLWEGAKLTSDSSVPVPIFYVKGVEPVYPLYFGEETPYPDLTHRPTANEALCRLALAMGASEEAVEEGVVFLRYGPREWRLMAGRMWEFEIDTDDRPTAIARAWKEHLDVQEG